MAAGVLDAGPRRLAGRANRPSPTQRSAPKDRWRALTSPEWTGPDHLLPRRSPGPTCASDCTSERPRRPANGQRFVDSRVRWHVRSLQTLPAGALAVRRRSLLEPA